ncbi:MAG: phosphate ABC transporter ATP-binding protein [Chloroflexi bacterium]|nr:MAG: phosphate ABC transporter ATP-binding protein [Chloroflexota bacterium]
MTDTLYRLENVEHRYHMRTVLRTPSLSIEQGEIFALVGPSGAGKSTLLRLLALLETPTQGTLAVSLGGQTFSSDTATMDQRRQLAMVFQRPALLTRSVLANVGYGLRVRGERDARSRIDAVLERVALTHLARAHPRTLSGGELQRVALARALVLEPKVLLLDEPTANLDPYNVRLIEDLVREQNLQAGTSIILVTHNIFQARRLATRVALLLDGQLIEVAPSETFFSHAADPRTAAFISGDLVY